MNWGRAKTILIVMFLAVDVFLLCVLIQTRMGFVRISEETLQATVNILQHNNIMVSKEQIPVQRAKNQNIIMRNYFEDPVRAAKSILGEFETIASNEEMHEYVYSNEKAFLSIKNTCFSYENKKEIKPFEEGKLPSVKAVTEKLTKLGFKAKEIAIVDGHMEKGVYVGQAVPLYKGMKIYGISMHITADSEAILSMEGNWFRAAETELYEKELLLDVTAVLSGLIYRQDGWPKEIVRIENGFYAADDYLNSREIAAVPVYGIVDQDNNIKCFDARMGHEIE